MLHTDWWGPYNTPGLGLNGTSRLQYIQNFIDDASGYTMTFCSDSLADGVLHLQTFERHLALLTNGEQEVRIMQSDSATVYTRGTFAEHCRQTGIAQRVSAPYSQAQNRRAERFGALLKRKSPPCLPTLP